MRTPRVAVTFAAAFAMMATAPAGARADDWRPAPLSCVSATSVTGCRTGLRAAGGLWALGVAPDGKTAFGLANGTSSVVIFNRDTASGALTQRDGAAGCVSEVVAGCTAGRGLQFPDGIVISPDGKNVYVTTEGPGGVAEFSLDANGTLTQLNVAPGQQDAGTKGCITEGGKSNGVADVCDVGRGLTNASSLAVSPDGKYVYVAGDDVAILARGSDGRLTQATDKSACIGEHDVQLTTTDNCTEGNGIGLGRQLTLTTTADSSTLYAPGSQGTLAIFDRTPATGKLQQKAGQDGCIATSGSGGDCTTDARLAQPESAVASPDGKQVYVIGNGVVLVYARTPDGRLGLQSCVNDRGTNGCSAGLVLPGGGYIGITPDGLDVVGESENGSFPGLVFYARDPGTGNLTQRPAPDTCVSPNGAMADDSVTVAGRCGVQPSATADGQFAFVDSDHFYAGGYNSGTMTAYKRDFYPHCADQGFAVAFDTALAAPFQCSDRNGDAMQYSITSNPVSGFLGAVDQAGARVFYNPFQGFSGADSFTYRATANGLPSNAATTTLSVAAAPPAPPSPQPTVRDADGDGFPAGQDCNDNDPTIRPGAREIRGNHVDENCDGIAEPFPTLTSPVGTKWNVRGVRFTLTQLTISQLPNGWKAQIQCAGKGCPFKRTALKGKAKRGVASVLATLKKAQRSFKAKDTVEVWVSAPGYNTKVARLALKKGKIPSTQAFCALPGAKAPQRSCS